MWDEASKMSKESAKKLSTIPDEFSDEVDNAKLRVRIQFAGLAQSAMDSAEALAYPNGRNCDAVVFRKCLE